MDVKKLSLKEILEVTNNAGLKTEDVPEIAKLLHCSDDELLEDIYYGDIKIFNSVREAFDYLFDVSETEDMTVLTDVIKATGELHCKNLEEEMINRAHDLVYYKDKIIFVFGY